MATGIDSLRSGLGRLAGAVRRKLRWHAPTGSVSPAFSLPPEDLEQFRDRMFSYWRTLGHPQATCEMFLKDAFNTDGYVDAVGRALRHMGELREKRVLDVGCGWGGLSRVLAACGAKVTMIDPHPPHVEIARARVPGATAMVGSGTDLAGSGLAGGQFDHVFVYSVIEHVGLPEDHRGDAGPVLETQRRLVREAARVLRPGGTMMISTGNYLFPFDGEVQVWFFHYLPRAVQKEFLQATGRSADRYGLLTWAQLREMTRAAGLEVAHVETCESGWLQDALERMLNAHGAGGVSSTRTPAMEKLLHSVVSDPDWMPMWHAFFRKTAQFPED